MDTINLCRSCTDTGSNMVDLSEENDLCKMFEDCTGILIVNDDILPKYLCAKCVEELQIANNFRSRSLQTNALFLENLNIVNDSIKSEVQHLPNNNCEDQIISTSQPQETPKIKVKTRKQGNTDLVCYICNEKLPNAKQMAVHKKTHFYYKCRRCKSSYKTSEECKRHKCIESIFGKSTNESSSSLDCQRILKCHICNQELMYTRSLRHHLRTHTGEKPCLCTMCGLKFREEKALINHTRAVHTKEKRFKCTFCPKAFTVSGKRREHERTHTGEKPYQCAQCSRLFGTRCALKAHTRRHTKQIIYKCTLQGCELGFYTYSSYQRHTWAHRGQRPYECDKCQKTYLSKQNLTAHQKSVHTQLKDQLCHICNKQFSEKSTLNRHLRSIHKTEPKNSKKPVPVYGFPPV